MPAQQNQAAFSAKILQLFNLLRTGQHISRAALSTMPVKPVMMTFFHFENETYLYPASEKFQSNAFKMGLINLTNGHFQLPGTLLLAPETPLRQFEQTYGTGSFQRRWKDHYTGYEEHYLATPVVIGEERYLFTFFFQHQKLVSSLFHVEPVDHPKPPLTEAETYDYYRSWLDREIGAQRVFDWGTCDLHFDPKSQFGNIELEFKNQTRPS